LSVPELSRFYGMVIAMFYNDHAPPHFHVRYGQQKATIALNPPRLLDGTLSPRALSLVIEWATAHEKALAEDWALARAQAALKPIPPLE